MTFNDQQGADFEAARLATLEHYDIEDTPPEEAFDRLTRLASQFLKTPMAFVSVVGKERQWFKSTAGFDRSDCAREDAFCAYNLREQKVLVVEDAAADPRFADNPLVTSEPNVRFYAGAPLVTPGGHMLGSLAVFDTKPRTLNDEQLRVLCSLRDIAMDELELRASQHTTTQILESISDAFFALDSDWNFTYLNSHAEVLLQRDKEDLLGKNVWDEFPEAVDLPFYEQYHKAVRENRNVTFEAYFPPLETWFRVNAYPFPEGLSVYFADATDEYRAREALRQRKERLSVTLHSIGDAVITTDPDGRVWDMNPVAEQLTGWAVDEAAGRNLDEVFQIHNAYSGEPVESPVEKVRAAGQIVGLANHTVLTSRDGVTYQIADSAAPMWGEGGELMGIVMVFRDVSEEYFLREQREEERQRFELALRGADLGLWDWNMNTGEVQYNERWAEMLGYDFEELEGTVDDFTSRAHPDDVDRVLEAVQQHGKGELPYIDLEFRMIAKDGSIRWILDRGKVMAWNDDGTPARAVGTHLDITERKRREKERKKREARVEALYDAMSTLAEASTQGSVARQIMHLVARTLHYPICAVRFANNGKLKPASVAPGCRDYMQMPRPVYSLDDEFGAARAFREQQSIHVPDVQIEGRAVAAGTVTARSLAYVPIPGYGVISIGAPEAESISTFDIRLIEILAQNAASVLNRIEREADLRDARDEAQEMSRLKSAFLANMSHEIRTPLTSILGFAEMLADTDLEEPYSDFVLRIQRSSNRLLETLTSVLDLSQLEAGALHLSPRAFIVNEVVEDAVQGFARTAEDKAIELTLSLPDEPVEVMLDRAALQRVVSNLVGNAVKFTSAGGVDVHLTANDEEVELRVSDTGVGISESFLPYLFDPFVQEYSGQARTFEGTGLGLAISRDLIELMQGEITVESVKGEGSTFTVRLPVDQTKDHGA